MAQIVLDALQQERAGFFRPDLGLAMKGFALLDEQLLDFDVAPVQVFLLFGEKALDGFELAFFFVDVFEFLVEDVGAFFEAAFVVADFAARGFGFGVEGFATAEGFFLGAEVGFLGDGFGVATGGGEDFLGFGARSPRAELSEGQPAADSDARAEDQS